MGVLAVITIIVIGYMSYRGYKKESQRKQNEAQETAARLKLEQDLKRKSGQWENTPFFKELLKYLTTNINEHMNHASTVKIRRSDSDSFYITCLSSYIDIRNTSSRDIRIHSHSVFSYDREIPYAELGFDTIQDDDSGTTIASLNLALFQYLKNEYRSIPQICFSSRRNNSLSDRICTRQDKSLAWFRDDFSISCDMTKVHPTLEQITLP